MNAPPRSTLPLSRREALGLGGASLLLPSILHAQAAPITTRIIVEDDRLWLAATVAGSKPYLFVIDTGAHTNFIRPEIAKELGLRAIDQRVVRGLGRDPAVGGLVLARDLMIGGSFRQAQAEFQIYDFRGGLPKDAAGLFAAGLFTTRDSELDIEKGLWRLWPQGRPDFTGLTALRSTMAADPRAYYSTKMIATVYLDGQPYRLLLDTGAPGGVLLFPPAARRSGLFSESVPYAPQVTAGFGGTAAKLSRIVRVTSLQVGPLAVERPLIALMDPDNYEAPDHDGILGLPFLQMLTLATDVRRRKLWAARNARPSPPDRYRISGLWLDKAGDGGATVHTVGGGSPAALAGVRAGDRIMEPATFDEALRRVNRMPGEEVVLSISRGGAKSTVRYVVKGWL